MAIEQASRIIEEIPEDHSIDLLGLQAELSTIATNREARSDLYQGLDAMEPGYFPVDYGQAMQQVNQVAAGQSLPVKVWLVTDLQANALPSQVNALYAPEVQHMELIPVFF